MAARKCISVSTLEALGIESKVHDIFSVLGLEGLYNLQEISYHNLTLEFLSSFTDDKDTHAVSFRLKNITFSLASDAFADHLGVGKRVEGHHDMIEKDMKASSEIVAKRVTKIIELMDLVTMIEDPQCELLLLRAYLQAKLLRPSGIVDVGPTFDDALRVFSETTGSAFLRDPSEIAAPKLMKKLAYICFATVAVASESVFSLTLRQLTLWKYQQGAHSSDWLRAVPISGLGQTMNARTYRSHVDCGAILETHVKSDKAPLIANRVFGNYNCEDNYGAHYNGRIWILWNPMTVLVNVFATSPQLIHISLLHLVTNKVLHITFVYAFNVAADKRDLWATLGHLSVSTTGPWVCMGDFNMVLGSDERNGSSHQNYAEMKEFSDCLDACGLGYYGNRIGILFQKLKALRTAVRGLHKEEYFGIDRRVNEAKTALLDCQSDILQTGGNSLLFQREKLLTEKFKALKSAEIKALHQRAKCKHIQLNDGSTIYFYSLIQERRLSKNIGFIGNSAGTLCYGRKDVAQAFIQFYTDLLGSTATVKEFSPSLFNQGTLLHAHQDFHTRPVSDDEILAALRSIDRNKSPGVDGYSYGFFLDAWGSIGSDFCASAKEYFVKGIMPKVANSTLITLIPKVTTLNTVGDFMPISLCTTFYKTMSKVIANRLREVLGVLVGPKQAAFVQGQDLFYNSLLAHELTHKYNRKHLTPRCILKVDIRKAFDSVNWEFIRSSLIGFGFPVNFIRILIPPKMCEVKPHTSCFCDDLLVFTRGNVPSVIAVARCLEVFAGYSGLQANPLKSCLYFGGVASEGASILLPKGIVKSIQQICSRLFWGYECGSRRMVYRSWASFCYPRNEGGMDIKEVLTWNKTQFLKWIWKLEHKPQSLLVQWVKAYIIQHGSFWQLPFKSSDSWNWSNLLKVRDWFLALMGTTEDAQLILAGDVVGKFPGSVIYLV
ncbi:uncharacterized protein LOC141637600 [Silene latifolia]|uniref:uncharacterized protein LOC141637600 n=1 Tax=Silene latifolia TaxID=37657 RepID=UPI003D789FDC